ncbi:MAG: hypothetical protein ABW133_04535, partial [Polyangiaceae bacterium]
DHGANQALFGGKVCIDATRKWADEGYRREWPEVCRFPADVQTRADALLAEIGLRDGARAHANGNGTHGASPRLRDVLMERLANAVDKG